MKYKIPPFQPQSSPPFDAWSCVPEAVIGCTEMVLGTFQEFAVSGLAVDSGTQVGVGTSLETVVESANEFGLISYASRPLQPVFNQSEYFAPITALQRASANKSMSFTIVPPNLNISPIILILNDNGVGHAVITQDMINEIDSYEPQIKPINWSQVVNQYSLLIKPKFMTAYGVQVPGNPTVYVPILGAWVPLASWQAYVNLGGTQQNIIPVTQQWLDSQQLVGADFFTT